MTDPKHARKGKRPSSTVNPKPSKETLQRMSDGERRAYNTYIGWANGELQRRINALEADRQKYIALAGEIVARHTRQEN